MLNEADGNPDQTLSTEGVLRSLKSADSVGHSDRSDFTAGQAKMDQNIK